ncbi:MAG: RidA family protein [Acidimicrobiales bacterium]|jgi:enamine deaminase RidA (YjgF/YER057c/UK114 family)
MSHEARLAAAGIELPTPMPPAGLYVSAVISGGLLHVGGHGPVAADGSMITGKVGTDVDLDTAKHAARLTGLQLLAAARVELGSLDRITRVVKVFGMVNCAPGFTNTPAVINGCSELFHEVFGEAGVHTRSAVGMAELPFDIATEIETIFEIAPN